MKRNWNTNQYEMSVAEWNTLLEAVGIARATYETMVANEQQKQYSTPFPIDWMQQKHALCVRALDILWEKNTDYTLETPEITEEEQLENSHEADDREEIIAGVATEYNREEEAIMDAEWTEEK